jgi:hypothetical protein
MRQGIGLEYTIKIDLEDETIDIKPHPGDD